MHFATLVRSSLLLLLATNPASASDGNRLTYLDGSDLYYVSRQFARLTTPQWVGEPGVEAVVVLAIDDMRDPARYEAYCRPILERLKRIDGRAALSIMTNTIKPDDPQLQAWLKEGLSLETHTIAHPCPCLAKGDFAAAAKTFHDCVDLLASVPDNRPVAFRMPCCDSLNTPSPRFYAEIFNRTSGAGNFLSIDTSVFVLYTPNDPALPRELVLEPDGADRFRKYLPADRSFVNVIEDYPYPYVIGRLCWEFPCAVPSDWEAQHLHKPNNPITVRDMKAAIDAAVIKQGTFNLVFHPHGWIRNDQVVDLIDHAVSRHQGKVKFLSFRAAQDRLDKHLLAGQPLRAANGQDNGVRLLDVNGDGLMNVVIGNEHAKQTRIWSPKTRKWTTTSFPVALVDADAAGHRRQTGVRFGVMHDDGRATLLVRNEATQGAWHFDGGRWVKNDSLLRGLEIDGEPVLTRRQGRDTGVRLRDLDGDGVCELLVGNPTQRAVFRWSSDQRRWRRASFSLPEGTAIVDHAGRDAGLRFVDVDGDGRDDLVFSNGQRYAVHLFTSIEQGWSQRGLAGPRDGDNDIPPIVRADGTNNGAWFNYGHMWVQNEDTASMRDHVDRRSLPSLLGQSEPAPRSPQASLQSMQVRPGFAVELMAAEPLTMDPVSISWGPDGKMWVVEMADYPLGLDDKGKPGGRVRYLEDTDGDGKYDKSTLFLDGIGFPSDATPWRNGVLVTAAPEIFYAEDTDGDGKADLKRVLYEGFREGNQQHRVNGLRFGLDNWLYLANGDSGGRIQSVKTGEVVSIGGRDLRIRPDEGLLDAQSGQTQYGRNRDDWGNWFGCSNPNPLWHYALADHYIRRNPHVAAPRAAVDSSSSRDVYAISRVLSHWSGYVPPPAGTPGAFTAACGAMIYRDELFGPAFARSAFTSEPIYNAVHRQVLTPQGTTFTGRRAAGEERREFLASTDSWFRPTTLRTGPDGALWVTDMYRLVLEHPEWIDNDVEKRVFLRAGHDKGRIYRVVPVGTKPRAIPRLDKLDTAGLVAALDSANGWQRDMAQQMLVWKGGRAAVAPLEALAANGKRPLARLHALCTLDGLGVLRASVVARGLRDTHPGVRRHAVRLSESLAGRAPELVDKLIALADDDDAQVRLQLAYSLGAWKDARAGRALGRILAANAADPFITAAALSSAVPHVDQALAVALGADVPASLVEKLVATAIGEKNDHAIARALARVGSEGHGAQTFSLVGELLDALARRNVTPQQLQAQASAADASGWARLPEAYAAAREALGDADGDVGDRVAAVRLLGRGLGDAARDLETLAGLLTPQTPATLQQAVIDRLGRMRGPGVPAALLGGWRGYSPTRRGQTLDVLLRRESWAAALLDAIQDGRIAPREIGPAHRQQLAQHRNDDLAQRARSLLSTADSTGRAELVARVLPAVREAAGDSTRGAPLFAKNCSACHRLRGVGEAFGPDLAMLNDKSVATIVTAVLDPSRAVEDKYLTYLAQTTDGLTVTGMLLEETGNSITLVLSTGVKVTILRKDLAGLAGTNASVMPEGLEQELRPQDLADIIAYVRESGPAPKAFAGNTPTLVRPAADGALRLHARSAEIYGDSLVFEAKYENLGFWRAANDRAVWSIEVTHAGTYVVGIEWACADGTGGSPYAIEVGPARVTGSVRETAGWDNYRRTTVGRIELTAGLHRLVARPRRKPTGFLMDLREITLEPSADEEE